jgi:hypothetical protein
MDRIRNTAAVLLAAAVYEMFPQVELLEGGASSFGFFYEFSFPHLVHPELHLQIEERMRQMIREKREIRCLEMVAASAKAFLKAQGFPQMASRIEGGGLFAILQIGSFFDFMVGECLPNTGGVGAFKLFPPTSGPTLRLEGAAFATKEELKEFLKLWNAYPKKRHEKVGELRRLWSFIDGKVVWLPEGVRARNHHLQMLKEALDLPEIASPIEIPRKRLLQELDLGALIEILPYQGKGEGLFDPYHGTLLQITAWKDTFPLQSIGKTLMMLGFHALSEDFCAKDGLGRAWQVAQVMQVSTKELLTVQILIERNLALLLEQ